MGIKSNNPRVRRQLRALDRFAFHPARENDSAYMAAKRIELAALQAVAARIYKV